MRAWKYIAALCLLCASTQPSVGIEFEPFSLSSLGRAIGVGCGDGYHARPCGPMKAHFYNRVTTCAQPFGFSDSRLDSYEHTHPNRFWQYPMQQQASCGCSSCGQQSEYSDIDFDLGAPSGTSPSPSDGELNDDDDDDDDDENSETEENDSKQDTEELPNPPASSRLQPPTQGVKRFESFGVRNLETLPGKYRPSYSYGSYSARDASHPISSQRRPQKPTDWQRSANERPDVPVWIRNFPAPPTRFTAPAPRVAPPLSRSSTRVATRPTTTAPRFRAGVSMPMQTVTPQAPRMQRQFPWSANSQRPTRKTERPAPNKRDARETTDHNSLFWY